MDKIRDKRAFRQSPSTVLREREPTSPETANRGNVNMVMDFSRQQEVVPSRLGATMNTSTNSTGKIMEGFILVNQGYCYICNKPQARIHRKCKEAS